MTIFSTRLTNLISLKFNNLKSILHSYKISQIHWTNNRHHSLSSTRKMKVPQSLFRVNQTPIIPSPTETIMRMKSGKNSIHQETRREFQVKTSLAKKRSNPKRSKTDIINCKEQELSRAPCSLVSLSKKMNPKQEEGTHTIVNLKKINKIYRQ